MPGTLSTLKESGDVPDNRKKRAVLAEHKDKRKPLRDMGKKLKKQGKKGK